MRSIPPADFATLPRLEYPAAYICVIRDIDSDTYRIDATDRPGAFVEAILDESERNFGIEFIAILATADLLASESEPYERHHARLADEWLELDALQLAELRRSILQIDAHSSHYLTPQRTYRPALVRPRPKSRYETLVTSYLAAPGAQQWRQRQSTQQPLAYRRYGAESLRRHDPEFKARKRRGSSRPVTLQQRFDYIMLNDPGCLLEVLIMLLLAGVAYSILVVH